jgi:hypothetical protein
VTPKSKSDPTLVYHIDIRLDWGEGPQVVAQSLYELSPAGRTVWLVGQGMLLKPASDPTKLTVEALSPSTPHVAVAPPPDGVGG